jgi:hypothetical protein
MSDDKFNIKQALKYISEKVDKIEIRLETNYVTQDQFKPVQKIAWLLLTLVVTGAIGFMFYLGRGIG